MAFETSANQCMEEAAEAIRSQPNPGIRERMANAFKNKFDSLRGTGVSIATACALSVGAMGAPSAAMAQQQDPSTIKGAIGGALGGLVGSRFGGGKGKEAAAAIGGIAGAQYGGGGAVSASSVGGGVLGAIIGNRVFKDNGDNAKIAGTVAGGALGNIIGQNVNAVMEERLAREAREARGSQYNRARPAGDGYSSNEGQQRQYQQSSGFAGQPTPAYVARSRYRGPLSDSPWGFKSPALAQYDGLAEPVRPPNSEERYGISRAMEQLASTAKLFTTQAEARGLAMDNAEMAAQKSSNPYRNVTQDDLQANRNGMERSQRALNDASRKMTDAERLYLDTGVMGAALVLDSAAMSGADVRPFMRQALDLMTLEVNNGRVLDGKGSGFNPHAAAERLQRSAPRSAF